MSQRVAQESETLTASESRSPRRFGAGLLVPTAAAAAVFAVSAGINVLTMERGRAVIDVAGVDLTQAVSTLPYEVRPIVRNDSNRTLRIVGAASTCGGQGCADVKGLPITLKPGESAPLLVHFKAGGAGPLNLEIPVYTDRTSQPWIALKLTGMVHPLDPDSNAEKPQ